MAGAVWHIGVDEAGYGPNLGPFVMSVVACRACPGNLWDALKPAVRRHDEDDDGRTVVADSKLIHTPGNGLKPLESCIAPFLRMRRVPLAPTLRDLLTQLTEVQSTELHAEFWFHGETGIPVEVEAPELDAVTQRLCAAAETAGIHLGLIRSVIVCTPRFNALIERWDSKAAVLGLSLAELLGACVKLPGREPFDIVVDKHGGRNTYSAVVQHAFPDGMSLAREESAASSLYEIRGMRRKIRVRFMPRAEEASFCVALASMVSKYLREVLMAEFNQFWLAKVPGLKPTAGYPGDSDRFFQDILPAVAMLGVSKEKIWRCR